MKKLKYIIMFSSMMLFLLNLCNPLWSEATTTANVNLKANRDIIEKGEEVEISFNIENQKTASYYCIIYFDETKAELVSAPENSVVDGNEVKVLWYDVNGGSGAKEGELGKIVFKAKEDGLANFVISGEFYSDKGQLIQTNFESLHIQIGKEETNLEKQSKKEQGNDTRNKQC